MKRSSIIFSLALLVGLGGLAVAQSVVQNQFSGNEVVRAAQGPGGSESWAPMRGTVPITTTSGTGAATSTATPGTLCWVGTAPTTWAVTLPVRPADGTVVTLCTDTTLTTMVTVTAGSGDTLTTTFSSQTLTANASFPAWQFKYSTRIWYRVN